MGDHWKKHSKIIGRQTSTKKNEGIVVEFCVSPASFLGEGLMRQKSGILHQLKLEYDQKKGLRDQPDWTAQSAKIS